MIQTVEIAFRTRGQFFARTRRFDRRLFRSEYVDRRASAARRGLASGARDSGFGSRLRGNDRDSSVRFAVRHPARSGLRRNARVGARRYRRGGPRLDRRRLRARSNGLRLTRRVIRFRRSRASRLRRRGRNRHRRCRRGAGLPRVVRVPLGRVGRSFRLPARSRYFIKFGRDGRRSVRRGRRDTRRARGFFRKRRSADKRR